MTWAALDPSSKSGFAIFSGTELVKHGRIVVPIEHYSTEVTKYSELPAQYPGNLLDAANKMVVELVNILKAEKASWVVIEHTEPSKRRFSQRFLEWLHLVLIKALEAEGIPFRYLLNSDWRQVVKCYLKHWPEHKEYNKQVGKARKKSTPTKTGARVAKIDGKVVSSIDQKKLSVILANAQFGLSLKPSQNDEADALNLGYAALTLGLVPKGL